MRTPPSHPVDHLGDFETSPRVLLILALALPVGALSAGVAWCLLRLIGLITNLIFYQRFGTALVAPGVGHHSPLLILLVPVCGGLVIGAMARFGSEKIRGHGIPEAIESILISGSKVQPRVALLKPISSAIAIGTGGPFGAEGPIIMTGGALGSIWAQLLHLTADERKTLLVAGAAAGMAATFNTPLASVLLAVELLLFEWRPRSFIPVVAAVAVATVIRVPLLGGGALFAMPAGAFHLTAAVYGLCLIAGLIAGLLALAATRLVYLSEDTFEKLPIHWMWWPAIGGLIVGIGGLIVPQALGVGYNVIGSELDGTISLNLIIGILIVKTLIWSLSLGSGTSGGVLAPMLMIGGALGGLEATIFPSVGTGFWPLIGLAGVLGGVMRSPLTGVVFALELTHRFDALLPLLIAATAAYGISILVLRRSVLTEKIARRGLHLTREYSIDPLEVLFVADVMVARDAEPEGGANGAGAEAGGALPELNGALPIANGAVAEAEEVVAEPDLGGLTVFPDDTLRRVAYLMAERDVTRLPVVARDGEGGILGFVTLQQLLKGRLKDLEEERHTERVLGPRRLTETRAHGDVPRDG